MSAFPRARESITLQSGQVTSDEGEERRGRESEKYKKRSSRGYIAQSR